MQLGVQRRPTDVLSKPLQIEGTDIDPIQENSAANGVVEPLRQSDDSRLSASGASDESCTLSGREGDGEAVALENGDFGSGWVVEEDVFKLDVADALGGLETFLGERVDDRD